MRKISFKAKTTIWISLLITVVCAISIAGLLIMGRTVANRETKQLLKTVVEKNADEIEYENSILEIESEFNFYKDGIYTDVYSSDFKHISGEIPYSLMSDIEFINGEIRNQEISGREYFIFDSRLDFTRYEYEIDVFSGQIIKYEANFAANKNVEEGEYFSFNFENGINTEKAIDIALKHAGISKKDAKIISADLPGYADRQVFRIDFLSNKANCESVWVRGIVPADATANAFNAITQTVIYIIPLFILLAAIGAYLISKKAMKRIEDITISAREISSGKDLSKRIEIKGNKDEITSLADTFNGMLERLQTSFESEKQFTSDASHELRTPLAVIKAESDFALSGIATDEDKHESLVSISEQTDKMTDLINALLSLTRTEQGTQRFNFEKANLSELIEEICKTFTPSKGITLNTDIEKDIYFNMDSSLISRLLDNLLSNAVRYGKENGYINVSLKKENNNIILSVKDNGIGISENDLPKIWGRFYRADSSRSNSNSFGLGLALVDRIATLHGGKADAKSILGEGSEFIINFFEKV